MSETDSTHAGKTPVPETGGEPAGEPASRHERIEIGEGLHFERIIFFSDAVFAIAITLLALDIRPPEEVPAAPGAVVTAVWSLLPQALTYALSFVVVGLFWVGHHRMFRFIAGYTYTLVWLNIVFLLAVAFIPVPTRVITAFGNAPAGTIFYALCLAGTGGLEWLVWWYATRARLVRPDLPPTFLRFMSLRLLALPAVFLLSIPIAFFEPTVAKLSWAVTAVLMRVLQSRYPAEQRLRA